MADKESLAELLLSETSRRNIDSIASLVVLKPELLPELMQIYLRDEELSGWRAAWVIDTLSEADPEMIVNYLDVIIERLPGFTSDGNKRSTLRMLTRYPVDEKSMGELMNICFKWLISPREAVAVKVHSMDILYAISNIEPDLKKELADSIEWRMEEETPGFRSHGKKLLKKLHKEMIRGKFE